MNQVQNDTQVRCEKMPQGGLPWRLARRIARELRTLLGQPSFLRNEDRRILEQVILPQVLSACGLRRVLFVGCDWYTKGYEAWFRRRDYATIDLDPAAGRFGARRHIVDGLQNIERHFPPASLDLIIVNGVFGWGLDAETDVERAVRGCHRALRIGGLLIIGVDDIEEHRARALENCKALDEFVPYVFPALKTADFVTDTPYRHRFLFFRRPA